MLNEILAAAAITAASYGLPMPPVEFSDDPDLFTSGDHAGVTRCFINRTDESVPVACTIYLDPCYDSPDVARSHLEAIMRHELAHYIDIASDRHSSNHTGQWYDVMRDLGAPRSERRRSGVLPVYLSPMACGKSSGLYF